MLSSIQHWPNIHSIHLIKARKKRTRKSRRAPEESNINNDDSFKNGYEILENCRMGDWELPANNIEEVTLQTCQTAVTRQCFRRIPSKRKIDEIISACKGFVALLLPICLLGKGTIYNRLLDLPVAKVALSNMQFVFMKNRFTVDSIEGTRWMRVNIESRTRSMKQAGAV